MDTAQEQQIIDEVTRGVEPKEIDMETDEEYNYASHAISEDMDQEWAELPPDAEAIALRKMATRREKWLKGCLDEYRKYLLEVLSSQGLDGAILHGSQSSVEELEEVYEAAQGGYELN